VHRTIQQRGYVGDGQVVQVAQRKHAAVIRREALEYGLRTQRFELHIPWILGLGCGASHRAQVPLLARFASPMIDELVTGDADEPGCRDGR